MILRYPINIKKVITISIKNVLKIGSIHAFDVVLSKVTTLLNPIDLVPAVKCDVTALLTN